VLRCEPATSPNFNLDGDDDDEIPSDDNMKNDGGERVTQKSTFEGGIRLLRRLPPALISALFVPCTVDDFWLADRESADSVRGVSGRNRSYLLFLPHPNAPMAFFGA
jgi:hypothetical protein